MLNQSFVLELLVNEHYNDLLKEANADPSASKEQFEHESRLKRFVAFLSGVRIGAVRPMGDQASLFSDGVINTDHR